MSLLWSNECRVYTYCKRCNSRFESFDQNVEKVNFNYMNKFLKNASDWCKNQLLKRNIDSKGDDGTSTERFIINSFFVPEHPIAQYSQKHKMQYLAGIQEALCFFFVSNVKVRFCFEQLYMNLLNEKYDGEWKKSESLKKTRNAISLKMEGCRLFSMAKYFWSDFFRIAFISGGQITLSRTSTSKTLNKVQWFYDKKTLDKVYGFFTEPKALNANVIEKLYLDNLRFMQQKEHIILVVGNMSAGKSTLINAIIGNKVEKVKATVCTSQLKYIYNKPTEDGITVSDGFNYAWTDKVDTSVLDAMHVALHFKTGKRNRRCVMIDTPGVNYAKEDSHRDITVNALNSKNYDTILYVMNALYFESDDEKRLLSTVSGIKGKRIVVALNQLDQLSMDDDSIEQVVNDVRKYVYSMVNGKNISVVPISAKAAYLANIPQEHLSNQECFAKEQYLNLFSSMFYDLGLYGTGTRSAENDLSALSGLTNLLNNIEL